MTVVPVKGSHMPLFRKKEKQPGAAAGPSDLFAVAPSGGRTFRMPDSGYEIWIPEGWRMGGEQREGKGRPVFYRERDPNGAVRITRLQPEGDPIESARGASEKTRGMKGVMDFQTEIQADRAWIRYRQIVGQQGQISQDTHIFLVATRVGSLLVTFTHDASAPEEGVRDEVAAFQAITDAIRPL